MNSENVLSIDFATILSNPEETLKRLAEYLDCEPLFVEPILPKRPASSWDRRIRMFCGTDPQSTAVMSFQARDLNLQSFTTEDKDFVHSEVEQIFPELWEMVNCSGYPG